ncbi:hypothetical protein [Burkholderia anthina]|uniref:hypothetical protein n=1 Tax=Burkholderia anthina TaxID=179879 RepID=UPI00158E0E2E
MKNREDITIARRSFLLLLAGIATLPSCATVDSLQPGSGRKFLVKGKSYDEIWKASVRSTSRNLTIVESNKGTGTIRAEARAGIATWGEVVGVFISPPKSGAPIYTVEVESLKRSRVQITGQDWETSIVTSIQAELDM